jgi:hypothetical protein
MKQAATGVILYMGDHDDLFPATMIVSATGAWAPSTLADHPMDWRSTGFIERHGRFWSNSFQPYMKNYQFLAQDGAEKERLATVDYTAALKQPATMSVTMNGLLQFLSQSAITEVSRLTMIWHGRGKHNYEGFSGSQPALRCSSSSFTTPCVFNPSGMPDALAASNQFGHIFLIPGTTRSYWTYSQGIVTARADTSAKFRRIGTNGAGQVQSVDDPFATYNAGGVPTGRYNCFLGSATTGYWCQMRPDFTFNFADYN